ncbi:hypothetical protein Pan216_27360 [Planctomycetes bacterium Pan216]|uniref:Uncharacterized protein n=1 Tax=Kolteria novifilia TaxID=2527975 RepID=A0A518B4G3_9BACT|nr:hypothetical protein Pan216_27360 [Planctomycetes bacterium Pan216]
MPVILVASLDQSAAIVEYVRNRMAEQGVDSLVADVGFRGDPTHHADIPREVVFEAAEQTVETLRAMSADEAGGLIASALSSLILDYYLEGKADGVFAVGDRIFAPIAIKAMHQLPFGIPKLVVTTPSDGSVGTMAGSRDILILDSVLDLASDDRISRGLLDNVSLAMSGMVCGDGQDSSPSESALKPLVALSTTVTTEKAVHQSRIFLEGKGYESVIFHVTGPGGRTMESVINEGQVIGVLDITTAGLSTQPMEPEIVGPDRLTAAGRRGIPQVISVGGLDSTCFASDAVITDSFRHRPSHVREDLRVLVRSSAEESAELGAELARRASASTGPTLICLPLRGISSLDAEGEPFWDPDADAALFQAVRDHASGAARVVELDHHIDDPEFCEAMVNSLTEMIAED